jgi:hypothetical protein
MQTAAGEDQDLRMDYLEQSQWWLEMAEDLIWIGKGNIVPFPDPVASEGQGQGIYYLMKRLDTSTMMHFAPRLYVASYRSREGQEQ